MNKYIDVDKLKAEIERRKDIYIGHALCLKETNLIDGFDEALNIIESLQQEQPEVDLEKFTEKIETFQGRYKHPESISIKGAMAFMSRMFYQYPNVARKWYEQLPKATMD